MGFLDRLEGCWFVFLDFGLDLVVGEGGSTHKVRELRLEEVVFVFRSSFSEARGVFSRDVLPIWIGRIGVPFEISSLWLGLSCPRFR